MTARVEQIGDATRITAIYALCEYPSWEPRYVGKTVQYLHERHKAHISAARRGRQIPVHRWLRRQIDAGERLAIKLLEYVQPNEDWALRERAWIAKFAESGRLLNLTAGGEGLPGHVFTPEHRLKIAAALRTGGTFACEVCGTEFWRKRRDVVVGHNRFCSRRCSNARHKGTPLL